jgi:CheY-like chemotaxis protein
MFFASKIRAVAEAVGVEVSFPRTKEALIEKAREAQLILVDLHNQRFDPVEVAQELRGMPRGSIKYYPDQCSSVIYRKYYPRINPRITTRQAQARRLRESLALRQPTPHTAAT